MSNNTNIPSCLSQEDINWLQQHPGQTLSNGGLIPSEVRQASRSVDVTQPARKGVRPNVTGNSVDHTGERITVSSNLAKKLADGDLKMRAAAKAQIEQLRASEEIADPTNINTRISYLERQLKKAMTEINRLKKENQSV